jgi:hypothetical protein
MRSKPLWVLVFDTVSTVTMKITLFWEITPCILVERNGGSEEHVACFHTLMMEAACFSQTSVDLYQTTSPQIPKGSNHNFSYKKNVTVVGSSSYSTTVYLTSVSFLHQQRPIGNLLTNSLLEVEHNFSQQHQTTLAENSRSNDINDTCNLNWI